jgi:hypothetical protein
MIVDLDAFRHTPAAREPYPHVVVPNFLAPDKSARIIADYPDVDVPGVFLPDSAQYGPAVSQLLADLDSAQMRRAVEEKLDLDLTGRPALITMRSRCRARDGKIHADSKFKLATLLLYLNESWMPSGGRLRILRSKENIDDYAQEVPPDAGHLVCFKVQENSWHGHTPYAGARRCVMVNYCRDEEVRDAEARRHRATLRWKKLQRFFSGLEIQTPLPPETGRRTIQSVGTALTQAQRKSEPFRHWLLDGVLPNEVAGALAHLRIPAPKLAEQVGRRDAHNCLRTFFTPEMQARNTACAEIAAAFQHPDMVQRLERETGRRFSGSFLRIEYCQDRDGFWLEPHTDIGAKLLTFSVFLSQEPEAVDWGTDLYDSARRHVGRVPAGFNRGYAFVPGADTLHGVERRSFRGVRRSIIVNYVKPEWRSRHELAFPATPIG